MRQSEAKASGMLGSTNQHSSVCKASVVEADSSCTVEAINILVNTSEHSVCLLDNLISAAKYILRPVEGTLVADIPVPEGLSPIENRLITVIYSLDSAYNRVLYVLDGLQSLDMECNRKDKVISVLIERDDTRFQSSNNLTVKILLQCISESVDSLQSKVDAVGSILEPFLSAYKGDDCPTIEIKDEWPALAATVNTLANELAFRVNHTLVKVLETLKA